MNKKMYSITLMVSLVFILISDYAFSQCAQLVWSDEFTGTGLNTSNWGYNTGRGSNGWGNNELQYYTDQSQNVSIINNELAIIARHQPNYLNSGANYTSGRILSSGKQSFTYGRIEARIKTPSADKIWPAFWMLPEGGNWPTTGEIDIMEMSGINPTKYQGTLHYNFNGHQYTGIEHINSTAYSAAYHTYAVEWEPKEIRFYVDSTLRGTLTPSSTVGNAWPFDSGKNFFIILNVAVGGNFVGGGTPSTSLYPDTMFVDWVRVHRLPSGLNIAGPTTVNQGDKGKNYTATDFGSGTTYQWTTSPVATIASTISPRSMVMNWGTSSTSGTISVSVTPPACTTPFTKTINVQVLPVTCSRILDDFDNVRNIGSYQNDGAFTVVSNPSTSNSVNSSANCVKYDRNGGVQYDVISAYNYFLGNPADFVSGGRKFSMDVYSSAPANTNISIQMEATSKNLAAYPTGRHSIYTGVTGPPNTWNRIIFSYNSRPDPGTSDTEADVLKILFNPNSNTSTTYYFDNLQYYSPTPLTSPIAGSGTICTPITTTSFSVTTTSGSSYAWIVPPTSTLLSGMGTGSISVLFSNTNGSVQVTETNKFNCIGSPVTKSISISPCTATGLFESAIEESSKVYPNPVQQKLTIENMQNMKSLKINGIDGRTIREYEIVTSNFEIDLSYLESGIYIIEFRNGSDHLSFKKIIKN